MNEYKPYETEAKKGFYHIKEKNAYYLNNPRLSNTYLLK